MITGIVRSHRLQSIAAYASPAVLALLLHVLIIRVYPLGIITNDTHFYLYQAQIFQLWEANPFDRMRTIPFGMLLQFASLFPQPTLFIFWLYATLFTLNMPLVVWAVRPLVRTLRQAWLISIIVLGTLTFTMRLPLYSLFVMTDPLYANLMTVGVLLILGSVVRGRTVDFLLLLGFAVTGLAAFIRPISLALFPVLIAGIICVSYARVRKGEKMRRVLLTAGLCCVLLSLPLYLWAARNYVVYGRFSSTASAGKNILPVALQHVEDSDILLPDPAQNAALHTRIRAFDAAFSGATIDNFRWHHTEEVPELFTLIAQSVPGGGALNEFWLDDIGFRIALRIISQHPAAFSRQMFRVYTDMMNPSSMWGLVDADSLTDVSKPYKRLPEEHPQNVLDEFYPGVDLGALQSNYVAQRVLQFLHPQWVVTGWKTYRGLAMLVIIHAFTLLCLLLACVHPARVVRKTAAASLFLMAIALAHLLLALSAGMAHQRLFLPAELPIALAAAMMLCIALPALRKR